jgi:hypothetical protein
MVPRPVQLWLGAIWNEALAPEDEPLARQYFGGGFNAIVTAAGGLRSYAFRSPGKRGADPAGFLKNIAYGWSAMKLLLLESGVSRFTRCIN